MKRLVICLFSLALILIIGCTNSNGNVINRAENSKADGSTIVPEIIKQQDHVTPTQNEEEQQSDEISINYECIYSGFVLEKDIFELPRGARLLNSEKEWDDFKSNYFAKSDDMEYYYAEPEDFTKYSVIYYSKLSPHPTIYASAFLIDKINVSKDLLNVVSKDAGNVDITISNFEDIIYRFVILAVVSKADLNNVTISSELETNEPWESIDRLHYVQGTIVSLENISDEKSILSLKIEKNYQSGPVDSEDYPFIIGETVEFYLNHQPEIDLKKMKRVILYESDVTSGDGDCFLAASIKYYEKDGKFIDMDGNQISLPPTEYPQSLN